MWVERTGRLRIEKSPSTEFTWLPSLAYSPVGCQRSCRGRAEETIQRRQNWAKFRLAAVAFFHNALKIGTASWARTTDPQIHNLVL
jgi:hypothetical protein